jgi:hypothetical protein
MATQHGGDLFDFSNMTDDEIRGVVVEHLREYPNLVADALEVTVRNGHVTLGGRVGTDAEVQVAEAVLDDVLGIETYTNDLVVDESRRYELPDAADDAAAAAGELDDQLGTMDDQQSDTAEHLHEDIESQTYGTHDVGTAVRDGATYSPPDRPVSDGYDSRENH